MKLLLLPLIIAFSVSMAYADSEDDASMFNQQGVENIELGNYDEAISYFDKALQMEPDNVTYLNNKGTVLILQEKYYEATQIFAKVLTIEPNDPTALDSYALSDKNLYETAQGIADIIIHDSHGNFISYVRTTQVVILIGDIANKELDRFVVKKITHNDQEFELIAMQVTSVATKDKTITKTYLAPKDTTIPLIITRHAGYVTEPGDVISTYYRVMRPIQ